MKPLIPPRSTHALRWLGAVAVLVATVACAPAPVAPAGADEARARLTRLQSDSRLAPLVPQAITDAESAVSAAEETGLDSDEGRHRVYIAQRRIEIAESLAAARLAEAEREQLAAELDRTRLEARTREVEAARARAAGAEQRAALLQQEIEELRAEQTSRGLVLTLEDVLFETGRADLKPGSVAALDRLATFLQSHPERSVLVEGHTDSVGSADVNRTLSLQRAHAVRSYLAA